MKILSTPISEMSPEQYENYKYFSNVRLAGLIVAVIFFLLTLFVCFKYKIKMGKSILLALMIFIFSFLVIYFIGNILKF